MSGRRRRRALVLGLAFARWAAPAAARASENETHGSHGYVAVPITFGLTRPFEVQALNDSLRDAGHSELSSVMPNLSVSVATALGRHVVIEPQYRFTIADSEDVTLLCQHILLNAGYLVVSERPVRLYPLVGVGIGIVTLDAAPTASSAPSFPSALGEPHGEVGLSATTLVLHAGLAANVWGSGHGDFLGLRAGALFDPISPAWKLRGHEVAAGPPVPLAGAYFAAALGFEVMGGPARR